MGHRRRTCADSTAVFASFLCSHCALPHAFPHFAPFNLAAIIYNSATDAHEVAAALAKQYDAKIKAYQCDVGDNAKLKATFGQIEKDLGNIVGVVAVRDRKSVV